ncbi:unnamed protein product [Vicia faba]|uniref:Uncharacterized protein n=1 Tax=Vicia faba TaxID=3906 RepID=A0AAV0YDJ9_VICFA|nr:unnamed protein product [Vicia faba]
MIRQILHGKEKNGVASDLNMSICNSIYGGGKSNTYRSLSDGASKKIVGKDFGSIWGCCMLLFFQVVCSILHHLFFAVFFQAVCSLVDQQNTTKLGLKMGCKMDCISNFAEFF